MPILELNADRSLIRRILRTISGALFPYWRDSAERRASDMELPNGLGGAAAGKRPADPLRQRLTEEVARLELLDADRERRNDSRFGKSTEDRIVWGELIELELQDIDEQVNRICTGVARRPQSPVKSNHSEGGSHESNDS